MTKVRGAVTGIHPLSEPVIQKILDYKYGRDSVKPAQDFLKKDIKSLIELQRNVLEFPIVSNGLLGLEDLLRPFTRNLVCLQSYQNIGDLPISRWHFTNTFYRKPTLLSKLPQNSAVLVEDKHTLTRENPLHMFGPLDPDPARLITLGPVSLVNLIETKHFGTDDSLYNSMIDLIQDAGRFLAQELAKLPSFYVEIQLDEPVFVWKDIPRALHLAIISAYQHIRTAVQHQTLIVNTYFGDVIPILPLLLQLPIDGIGIDFEATNPLELAKYSFEDVIIQAGLIDAENYILDANNHFSESHFAYLVKQIQALQALQPKEILLASNTGLEYLPRQLADYCLKEIGRVVQEVNQ